MSRSLIRAIFFDLDDTLYAYEPCQAAAMSALFSFLSTRLDTEVKKIHHAFEDARAAIHARLPCVAAGHSRLLYAQECIEALLGRTDVALTVEAEECFWRVFLDAMELRPGVDAFLAETKQRGIVTAIVTDLTTQIQLRKIHRLGIGQSIDWLVTSEESGVEKPDPASFRLAAQKTGIPLDNTLMIGESYAKDILPARTLGMQTVYLNLGQRKEIEKMQAHDFFEVKGLVYT